MADYEFILVEQADAIGTITLNRPEVMNAWNAQMRKELADALAAFDGDEAVRAIILTGAGDKAFCAGQDLNETKTFDPDRAELWIGEWRHLYGVIRNLTKPLVCALNGVAAGSAFQVSLLTDIRIGHPGVRMGQPEINSGIASTLGPWIMREMLGLSRTIELTLTGRIMNADEAHQIGLIHEVVPQDQVKSRAREVAQMLAEKPPVAMRLNKRRFRDVTQAAFEDALEAGVRHQREAYGSGEPQRMMEKFFADRAKKKQAS